VIRKQSIDSIIIVPNFALSATKYPIYRFILMLDNSNIHLISIYFRQYYTKYYWTRN